VFDIDEWEQTPRSAFVFAGQNRTVSYSELRRLVRDRSRELGSVVRKVPRYSPLVTSLELPFIVDLVAHFELGLPVLLVDPRLTEAEQARLVADGEKYQPHPEDRVVLGTSGSTGRPKLVVHTQQSLIAAAKASEDNLGWLDEGDRWYLSLPLGHVGGLSLLVRCLLGRQTVVIGQARSSDPEGVLRELEAERVTLASFVPTQLQRLLSAVEAAGLPSLRAILVGGAPVPRALRIEAESRGLRTLSTYGLTEMSSQVATERFKMPVASFEDARVGPPLVGVQVRVNADGRLCIRGPMAMRGYLNHESPFDKEGFLVTNDIGAVDASGNVHVFGRVDNVIITGGENVAAEFVEAALLSVRGVQEACVVGVPDKDWGSRVVALVVPSDAPGFDAQVIQAELRELLPAFARPKEVRPIATLPLLGTGKIDRARVKSWFSPPSPGGN
jgi:o-succinylbenzoate---CoA ligase